MVQLLLASFILLYFTAVNGSVRNRRQIDSWAIRWDDNTIPFLIDSTFSDAEQLKLREAMSHISSRTCIIFKDLSGREVEQVSFGIKFLYSPNSCHSSDVGRAVAPGFQEIRLHTGPTKDCLDTIGIVVHEILHALGFEHTIGRPDRDKHISIDINNIHLHHRVQFENFPMYLYSQYDYSSNLHYGSHLTWNSSSINPLVPTIISKDKRYIHAMGNRRGGSFLDFHALNKHYRCYDKCDGIDTVKCKHRGVPNPKNCSSCVCTEGYAGRRCELKPDNCGMTLQAEHTWNMTTLNVGTPEKGREYKYENCITWIKAPKGYDVEIEILSVETKGVGHLTLQEKVSCRLYGLEVKIKGNPRLGGPVFCMPEDIQQRFISRTSMAPVILFNRKGYQEYRIRYRATKRSHPRTPKEKLEPH